jgi:ribosomal-protein-alanine N-acetyltransferase
LLVLGNGSIIEAKYYRGESVTGYASARVMVFDNTVDVLRIAVRPEKRRSGMGKLLLRKLEEICLGFLDRPAFFMLEVSESNTAAIHLYGSSGYKIIHRRKSYYRDSSSAMIMRKDIRD